MDWLIDTLHYLLKYVMLSCDQVLLKQLLSLVMNKLFNNNKPVLKYLNVYLTQNTHYTIHLHKITHNPTLHPVDDETNNKSTQTLSNIPLHKKLETTTNFNCRLSAILYE